MKIIKRFWGVALVVILLSTMFVGAAAPVSAADYRITAVTIPSIVNGVLGTAGFSVTDVAASGSTIYATATDTAALDYIYKSADGGATWAPVTAIFLVAGTWNIVAVAPDDPNIVVVVDTAPAPDVVYLSTNGGATFTALGALAAGAVINDVSISPTNGVTRFIAVGGATGGAGTAYLQIWTVGVMIPAWAPPGSALLVPATVFNPATPIPAGATGIVTLDDVQAVEFSPSFLADQCLTFVTETFGTAGGVAGEIAMHIYSFNTQTYDAAVSISFPRILEASAGASILAMDRAQLILDPNFYIDDESTQIGFIAANIDDSVAAGVQGGIYRVGTYTVAAGLYTMSQIMTGSDIYSVAWDGTNLMAGQYDVSTGGNIAAGLVIWRSASALGAFPSFQQNTTVKTIGTGSRPLVLFNGGVGLGFSQGPNAAIARTTDLGKSFNGFALVNSDFTDILDFWVSPDGVRIYALTDDTVDTNLWRKSGAIWERVMILATDSLGNWLVRADAGAPDTVYLGRKGAVNMWKSLDAGNFVWTVRSANTAIADFEVQDALNVYVASAAAGVSRSINGAFTWLPGGPTLIGAALYDIALISDGNIVVGGTNGRVAYSTDAGVTFTTLLPLLPGGTPPVANTCVAASGLATGDSIFISTPGAGAGTVGMWTIGLNTSYTLAPLKDFTGVAYGNGIVYSFDNAAPKSIDRWLAPSPFLIGAATDVVLTAATVVNQVNMNNSLQMTTGNTIYLRDAFVGVGGIDIIYSFTDPLYSVTAVPTLVSPIYGVQIPVNSITGLVNPFNFSWNAPEVSMPLGGFNYNLVVYLDELGTIPVAGGAVAGNAVLAANSFAVATVVPSNFNALAGTTAFAGIPGATYWWRVRVDNLAPLQSYWSTMHTFSVQALQAIVPVIGAPANGAVVNNTNPSFSWNPISGATSYKFELDTGTTFTAPLYSVTATGAGIDLPISVVLEHGRTYFWRVKTLTPTEGDWSTIANFTVAEEVTTQATTTTTVPAVTVTPTTTVITSIVLPASTSTVITMPAATQTVNEVNPTYIWAIIIIGAVLVLAVIVLIVRTRRSV